MVTTELAGIKLPKVLFDAAKNGELVVFAGAGVSMQGDSPLPDFVSLVEDVSLKVDVEHKLPQFNREVDSCEDYLGELEMHCGVVMREECAKSLSGGTFAEIHRNIIGLFDSSPVRVVTTNFDQRFEQAAEDLGHWLRVFCGPALPVGDSFEGLVHLHGSLEYPNEMVLNDSDFGKAYVSDGWASRFLVRMFSRFKVLFVGYSFSDTLIKYLARSISADVKGRVFALEREEDKFDVWSKRGIIPVHFDSYDQLPRLFFEWHRRDAITVYECSKIVEHVAAFTYEASSDEKEELVRLLVDSSPEEQAAYAEVYAHAEQGFSAVKLLVDLGFDDFLFKEELSSRDSVFAAWIARAYAISNYAQLMLLAAEEGKRLSGNLCSRVLFELLDAAHDKRLLSAWASYIEPSMLSSCGSASYCFCRIIRDCHEPRIAFSWIHKLFAIKPVWRRDFLGNEPCRPDPVFVFECDDFFKELVESTACYAESLGWDLFWFLVNQLEEARDLETGHGSDENAFDSWCYGRSAIEEHEQDKYSKGLIDVLVDVLRDTGVFLMSGSSSGIHVVERCVGSQAHLVKRMGLYLLPFTGGSADYVLNFLIGHGCLRDSYLIHETFMLLSTSYPDASSEAKAAFINEVLATYPDAANRDDAYGRFNVLKWLEKFVDEDESISSELATVRELFPDFEVREYPDLTHSFSSDSEPGDERFGVSEDDFSPEKLRELCTEAKNSRSMFTAWEIVSAAIRRYPEKGLDVTRQLLSSSEDEYREMTKIALSSICWGDIEEGFLCDATELLIAGLQREDTYPSSVRSLKTFVESLKDSILDKEALWQSVLDLAFSNIGWLSSENYSGADSDSCDWLTVSINHAGGALIGIVSKIVCALSEVNKEGAREFGKRYLGRLLSQLDESDNCSKCLAASLLSEVNVWVFVDAELMRLTFSRVFEKGSPFLVPALRGLSYVSRLSEGSWDLLKAWFMHLLNAAAVGDESLRRIGSLFVWGAIVFGGSDDRRRAVAISSAVSPWVCSAVSFRLFDWVKQLKDDARIAEWDSWLCDAVRSMFASDENFKAAGRHLVRWLVNCGCLAPEVGSLLIDWRKRACDGIYFEHGTLHELIAKGAVGDTDRALLLVFFLSASPTYLGFDEFEEAVKGLDTKALDKTALSELRDAFVLRFAVVPRCLE